MMKKIFIFLFVFSIVIAPTLVFSQLTYVNSADPRYTDVSRYVDPNDPRVNELEAQVYVDPLDNRLYSPLNQINGVKPFQGNINFYSSDESIRITPDYVNSRINLVSIPSDTNTISELNWSQLSSAIPWADVNVVDDLTINSTKDIRSTLDLNVGQDIEAGSASYQSTVYAGNFFGNYSPFLGLKFAHFGIDTSRCILFGTDADRFVPCASSYDIGAASFPFGNIFTDEEICIDGSCIDSWSDVNISLDTNCAISGSCQNIAYKNTDVNFEDVNAQTFTAQIPGGTKYSYGTGSKAIESPFPTACNEIFGVVGFANTGLEFCASPWTAIAFRLLATPIFLFYEGGANAGGFYQLPQTGPLSNPPILGTTSQWATFLDGNHFMLYPGSTTGWVEAGTRHSRYSPDFLFQSGDFNGHVDFNSTIDFNQVTSYKRSGEIRFYGSDQNAIIDYNIATDQNRLIFDLNDRNSSFLVSQRNTTNQEFNSFMLDGNGNPYFFRVPTFSATLPALTWDQNTGRIVIRASDSDLKEDIQDNPYDTSWCYDLQPKIWTDKETGYPGVGYLAEDIELLLKSNNIPTWMIPTDHYGNKTIIYEAINEFCWKAAIDDHKKLEETKAKIDLIIQLVCPIGKIDPLCEQLKSQTTPV